MQVRSTIHELIPQQRLACSGEAVGQWRVSSSRESRSSVGCPNTGRVNSTNYLHRASVSEEASSHNYELLIVCVEYTLEFDRRDFRFL